MLNSRLTKQLKLFFLEQYMNLGLIENEFIRADVIINKILQDPELNTSFCKIFFPDMGVIKILSGKWVSENLEDFFGSETAQQILEIYKDQNSNLVYIKLLCIKNKVACDIAQYHQQRDLLSLLIKNIIQQDRACPLSVIKEQLVIILNKDTELKIFLQPLLIKLTNKNVHFDEQICFKNGDLVRCLRRMNFLDSYKSTDEIYFYLKTANNPQTVTFTKYADVDYKVQQEHGCEQIDVDDNNLLSIRSTRSCP